MKHFLLFLVVAFNLSCLSAYADDQVAQTTATSVNQDLPIDLPANLPSGHHSASVDVTDPDTGQVTTQTINFCKDTLGVIHWDDVCPDVTVIVPPSSLEHIKNVEALPNYSPASEPTKTSQTQVAGFTAISVLSAGGAAAAARGFSGGFSGGNAPSNSGSPSSNSTSGSGVTVAARREELGKVNDNSGPDSGGEGEERVLHAAHAAHSHQTSQNVDAVVEPGLGDLSKTWKAPFGAVIDSALLGGVRIFSPISPLISKILLDASYLRAVIGSLTFFTLPIGIYLGFESLLSNHMQPMPPSWGLMAALISIGVFDALSGFIGALIFTVGDLLGGHIHSLGNILTIFAFAAICSSPAIIASSFRPLQRKIESEELVWERLVDYFLSAVLTGWTLTKFVGTLNVIAGKQLAIVGHSTEIGIFAGISVLIRMLIEDLAIHYYPQRISRYKVKSNPPSKTQQYISLLLKGTVFALVMKTFVGFDVQLIIGTALFILPSIAKLEISHLLPKSSALHLAMPKGGVRIVFMTLIGTLFATLSKKIFHTSHDFITWGFVLLSLPAFLLSMLELLSDQKRKFEWNGHEIGKWAYRLGGVVVFYLIVQIVLGHNLLNLLTRG